MAKLAQFQLLKLSVDQFSDNIQISFSDIFAEDFLGVNQFPFLAIFAINLDVNLLIAEVFDFVLLIFDGQALFLLEPVDEPFVPLWMIGSSSTVVEFEENRAIGFLRVFFRGYARVF